MLEYIFRSILVTSLIGTALAVFLRIIKPVTGKFFSCRWNYYAWLIVLISMVVPFRISEQIHIRQNDSYELYSPIQGMVQTAELQQGEMLESVFAWQSNINTIAVIWITVACVLFLLKLLRYWSFVIRLKNSSDVILCPELKHFTDKEITVRVSDSFSSPFLTGIFKSSLVLPKASMTDEQLCNILAHETVHFKRKDILYKWFVSFVKCVHWFNPMIYYVGRQIDIECEMSCDEAVVKNMSDKQRVSYIDTIINLLSAGNRRESTVTTGMLSEKKILKRRFTMIKDKKKISKKALIVSIALILVIIGCTVFASGVLNGKLVDEPKDDSTLSVDGDLETDEIITENGKIQYDTDDGDVISVVSEPKLVEEKETKSEIIVDTVVNEQVILEEVELIQEIENPVEGEAVSLSFGKREHPITKEIREHNGIDIKAQEGTEVKSSISGTVTEVGYNNEKGNYIVIENTNIKTLYAQLESTKVKTGDEVLAKQTIGTVGKTGNATGAHLHFEVMVDGEYQDPESLIR